MTQDADLRQLAVEEIEAVAGGNIILEAGQAYQAWFTCLKSCAESKGQIQGELARFR